jgi:glycosidase
LRDFTKKRNYQTLTDTLDYLQRLGINAIELMPVNEFDGNLSWGYNPTYHYALDKYYGTPEAFKTLVDECHSRGIAVILDVVFNHAHEKNPLCMLYWDEANFRPAADNPWLNQEATHDFNVFFDFNHESAATKFYVKKTIQHWLSEYHVDGYRFDLSKGLTQNTTGTFDAFAYDASRIATLKDYADAAWAVDDSAYVILEHFAANTEEEELSDYGCMLWGGAGISNQFLDASMGYASTFAQANYQTKGWADPHLIAYMESHDEERMMFDNLNNGNSSGSYNIRQLPTALDRSELTSVLYLSIPGPKMLWQFFEMGYDYSINHCEDGTISPNCRLSPKPVRWDYMANPDRLDLWNIVRKMNLLRTNYETFRTDNFFLTTNTFLKTIHLNHPDMNALVLGNFNVTPSNIVPNFQHTGWWYEYFTGDSLNVENPAEALSFAAGEYRLYTDKPVVQPSYYTDTEELVQGQPFEWAISPNPTTGDVTFDLVLEKNAAVRLSVLDAFGRLVADFGEETLPAGQLQLRERLDVGSGVYFVVINVAGRIQAKKLVVE